MVQWSWPSGTGLQARVIRACSVLDTGRASTLSSTFLGRLTWLWCLSASASPSSAYRRLVRNTVRSDTSSAAAVQPASIFNRIRPRVMGCAELLPALIICLSRPFSCVARRTPYFSRPMTTSHPTTLRLSPRWHPIWLHVLTDNTSLAEYQDLPSVRKFGRIKLLGWEAYRRHHGLVR